MSLISVSSSCWTVADPLLKLLHSLRVSPLGTFVDSSMVPVDVFNGRCVIGLFVDVLSNFTCLSIVFFVCVTFRLSSVMSRAISLRLLVIALSSCRPVSFTSVWFGTADVAGNGYGADILCA